MPYSQLDAALAREKELRKKLTAAQRQISQHRLEVTALQSESKNQVDSLKAKYEKTKAGLQAAVVTLTSVREQFSNVSMHNGTRRHGVGRHWQAPAHPLLLCVARCFAATLRCNAA